MAFRRRDKFEASMDKRIYLEECEKKGLIADSMAVRAALVAKMQAGEMTLEQVQSELEKIKRSAKKNGQMTRSQAYRKG